MELEIVEEKGKYGIKAFNSDNWLIEPIYNSLEIIKTEKKAHSDYNYILIADNKYGLIYKYCVILEPEYNNLEIFSEEFINRFFYKFIADDRSGLVWLGKLIVPPIYYKLELSRLLLEDKSCKYIKLDTENKSGVISTFSLILKPEYLDLKLEKYLQGMVYSFIKIYADKKVGLAYGVKLLLEPIFNIVELEILTSRVNPGYYQEQYFIVKVDNKSGLFIEMDNMPGRFFWRFHPEYDKIEFIDDYKVKTIKNNEVKVVKI